MPYCNIVDINEVIGIFLSKPQIYFLSNIFETYKNFHKNSFITFSTYVLFGCNKTIIINCITIVSIELLLKTHLYLISIIISRTSINSTPTPQHVILHNLYCTECPLFVRFLDRILQKFNTKLKSRFKNS